MQIFNLRSKTPQTSTVTLTSANWSGSAAPYTQTISLIGISSNDIPFCQADCSNMDDAVAWGTIFKADSGNNVLTFTAAAIPSVDLNILVTIIR